MNRIIIVICEGPSEYAYIQELNRFLKEENIPIKFIGKSSDGGQYSKVIKRYKKVKKDNPRDEIVIWIDWDRYLRNDAKDRDNYLKKPSNIPDFLFSYMNYEDFLIMHMDDDILEKWLIFCNGELHFKSPLHSKEYLPEYKKLIEGYSKGDFPIELNACSLKKLKERQNNSKLSFKCDFALKILTLIEDKFTI